ncbi:MAG: hypothetical protein H2069_10520 [Legionella sp.]|nr:hypothetical protein [Legionella sp.]
MRSNSHPEVEGNKYDKRKKDNTKKVELTKNLPEMLTVFSTLSATELKEVYDELFPMINTRINDLEHFLLCAKKTSPDIFKIIVHKAYINTIINPELISCFLKVKDKEVTTHTKRIMAQQIYRFSNFTAHFPDTIELLKQVLPKDKLAESLTLLINEGSKLDFTDATQFFRYLEQITVLDINDIEKQHILDSLYIRNEITVLSDKTISFSKKCAFLDKLPLSASQKEEAIKHNFYEAFPAPSPLKCVEELKKHNR